jgi:hypothetical protein
LAAIGLDPEAVNDRTDLPGLKLRKNALHVAAENGRLDDVIFLLEIGADVKARPANTLHTAEGLAKMALKRLTTVSTSISAEQMSRVTQQKLGVTFLGYFFPLLHQVSVPVGSHGTGTKSRIVPCFIIIHDYDTLGYMTLCGLRHSVVYDTR